MGTSLGSYETLQIYSTSEFFDLIDRKVVSINGAEVDKRIRILVKDKGVCRSCGLRTSFVAIQRNGWNRNAWHFNFWATSFTDEGRQFFTQLTRDHIIPKSLGGTEAVRNGQCLCEPCNGRKGSNPLGHLIHVLSNRNTTKSALSKR